MDITINFHVLLFLLIALVFSIIIALDYLNKLDKCEKMIKKLNEEIKMNEAKLSKYLINNFIKENSNEL